MVKNLHSHLRSYLLFCLATGHPHLQFSIEHLCNFLAFLSRTVSYRSVRNYVSSLQIFYELHHIHVHLFHDFCISLTLRGSKRLHGYSPQAKLPITPQILTRLHSTIDFSSTMGLLFWAACLLAFFTFFRKFNLFLSSPSSFDPVRNLTRNDFQILPSFALINVNWTKTIQFDECSHSIPIP